MPIPKVPKNRITIQWCTLVIVPDVMTPGETTRPARTWCSSKNGRQNI